MKFYNILKNIFNTKTLLSFQLSILILITGSLPKLVNNAFATTLRGICTDTLKQPLANASVEIYFTNIDSLAYRVQTNTSGIFTVENILEKEYRIKMAASGNYPEQWYSPYGNTVYPQYKFFMGPAMTYDTLRIIFSANPANNPSNCNLSVTVIDSSGNPLLKSSVELIREMDHIQVAKIKNDTTSTAKFVSLQPARYAICIEAYPYPRQFFDTILNNTSAKHFIPLAINESKSITVRLTMQPGGNGFINGKIINESSLPIEGLTVSLYRKIDSFAQPSYHILTAPNGVFTFANIFESDYHLKISGRNYPDQWFSPNGNTSQPQYRIWVGPAMNHDTMRMTVTSNPINNSPTCTLSVTVLDSSGKPLQKSSVELIRETDRSMVKHVYNDSNTAAKFINLQPDRYAICMEAYPYPRQYFDTVKNSSSPKLFIPLVVNENKSVSVRLTILPTGNGFITGKLLNEASIPLEGLTVSLFQQKDSSDASVYKHVTSSSGIFSFENIFENNYYLKITGGSYPDQWYSKALNKTVLYRDDPIWSMPSMHDSLRIYVSSSPFDNQPRSMVKVRVYTPEGQVAKEYGKLYLIETPVYRHTTFTKDSSTALYSSPKVKEGQYAMAFDIPGYPYQFFNPQGNTSKDNYHFPIGKSETLFIETNLTRNITDTQSTKNFAYISGFINDSIGPIKGANIRIYEKNGNLLSQVITDSSGKFNPVRVPVYTMYLSVEANGYPVQYWTNNNGRPTASITAINYFSIPYSTTMSVKMRLVKNPQFLSDSSGSIDTSKSFKWKLNGQVNDGSGPISGVKVVLLQKDQVQNNFSPQHIWTHLFTYTDSAGMYTFYNPPMGNYIIAALADSVNFVPQFFKNSDIAANASIVRIDTSSLNGINFSLRKGGIVKGSVIDESGNSISNARITLNENTPNGRYYECISGSNGNWAISGVPSGKWHSSIHHEHFLPSQNYKNDITVTEGTTINVEPYTMNIGGRISGTTTSVFGSDSGKFFKGSLQLYSASVNTSNDILIRSSLRTDIQFSTDSFSQGKMKFISGLCPTGTYTVLFTPDPVSWNSYYKDTNMFYFKNYGHSFLNNNSSSNTMPVTILKGDTNSGNTISLKSGYSVIGFLTRDGSLLTSGNYYVNAFIKSEIKYIQVSSSHRLENGKFELPGLINGEQYYIQLWADGYPDQFWSPSGKNNVNPKDFFTFDTTNKSRMIINLVKDPEGSKIEMNEHISLWTSIDSSSVPILKWSISQNLSIDTMHVYARDQLDSPKLLAVIPFITGKNAYEYKDTRTLSMGNEYCIIGRGKGMTVRSERLIIDTRRISVLPGNIWIGTNTSRHGIEIEWGLNDTNNFFNQKDTVVLYKRLSGGVFREINRRPAWEHNLMDHDWKKSDSLKTYEYKVEIPSLGKTSQIISFTLNASFFAGLAKELKVGPNEKYTKIQQAIDAAGDNDFISVRSGKYSEQLNFRGKNLNLYGQWDNGYPATIDASGGTAITLPFCKNQSFHSGGIYISGFKITNAGTAIFTNSQLHIDKCLFAGVSKGIVISPDSSSVAQALASNPFTDNSLYVMVNNCTFVATSRSSLAASTQSWVSGTSANTNNEYDKQLVSPLKSISSQLGFNNSLFAFYGTNAASTTFPMTVTGNHANVWIDKCASWQTPVVPASDAISFSNTMISHDPKFLDTAYYFCGDSSKLREMGIGYNYRDFTKNDENRKELTAIKNLITFNKSVNKIELQWDPAPQIDNAIRYRIFRLPGDPSLFYINDSLWDITINEDSLMKVMETFSTEKTFFVDTTVKPGQQYLYVVCSVDSNDNESQVLLSASKPIQYYFSNVIKYELSIKSNQWVMVSPWGSSKMTFESPNMIIYQWNPKQIKNKLLSFYSPIKSMTPGMGYWVKSLVDTVLKVTTNAPQSLHSVQDTLRCVLSKGIDGWNQVASPFPHRINPKLPTKYVIWEWIEDSMGYKRAPMMEPWKGYWIFTEKDTSFLFNSGENYIPSTKALAKRTSLASWELTLSLMSTYGNDPENICGVIPNIPEQLDIPEPPQPFGGNHLYFVKKKIAENTEANHCLSYQYLESTLLPKENLEWQVAIKSPDGPCEVKFSGVETCPEELGVFWIYKGNAINLRKANQIKVLQSSEETFGYMVATVNPIDIGLYSALFSLRSPYPNPSFDKVTVEYIIPYHWDSNGLKSGDAGRNVSIVLYDISGRLIHTILDSKKAPGKHTAFWNGKLRSGHLLGAGVYIMRFKCDDIIKNVQIFRLR